MKAVGTPRLMTQGAMAQTGKDFDVAIRGDGFFKITMPDGRTAYTRDGSFELDAQGRIVTAQGNVVQPGLTLPANASSAILRIEVEPGSPFTSFQFQLFDSSKRLVTTATSGKASARGSVAVRVPAEALQNGKYLVKCYGVRDGQRELIGEYDLLVRKP